MKPTLLILAAGMGSRFGGIKQIEPVGSSGEIILEYSVFDAWRAGFGKVVFVIREDIRLDFEKHVLPRFSGVIPCECVIQDVQALPVGFQLPSGRTKPWGTGHAVLCAKSVINEPFAVINADDFYGKDAFRVMADFLVTLGSSSMDCSMVAYRLENTLSEHGTVSRGICRVDSHHRLQDIREHTKITKKEHAIVSISDDGSEQVLNGQIPVSMNLFGFSPAVFQLIDDMFTAFLNSHANEMKSEFYIPSVANEVIARDMGTMHVLNSKARWFGITYQEDRELVVTEIQNLTQQGEYPVSLWS